MQTPTILSNYLSSAQYFVLSWGIIFLVLYGLAKAMGMSLSSGIKTLVGEFSQLLEKKVTAESYNAASTIILFVILMALFFLPSFSRLLSYINNEPSSVESYGMPWVFGGIFTIAVMTIVCVAIIVHRDRS